MFQSLTLIYKTVFVQTLLYGAQVWTNLTKLESQKLQTLQLQFLKRILQVPKSTSNCVVFLELGVLPIIYEIHRLQLTFLHHILTLSDDDPVLRAYEAQGYYIMEKNWANDSKKLREEYELNVDECEIAKLEKVVWKNKVKEAVTKKALKDLCEERHTLSRASDYPRELKLAVKEYFFSLNAGHARLLFRIRCKNWDIKAWRQYMYNDLQCRLCGEADETLEHVLAHCTQVSCEPLSSDIDVYSEDEEIQRAIARRAKLFADQVLEKGEEESGQ